MEWKLELIVLPVSDIDRAKGFYTDKLDFNLDVDHRAGDFRAVQLTPRGSSSSIPMVSRNASPAGSHPARANYGSFFSFSDPDGNGWVVQEVRR